MNKEKIDWRKYLENGLTTDALWITPQQKNGKHLINNLQLFKDYDPSTFHGIFIPEIPYQFITRYTMYSLGWIWDPFAGNNTTYYVAEKLLLQHKVICSDINPITTSIMYGDAENFNPESYSNNEKISLTFVHPPYFNIIKYSTHEQDLSNTKNLESFYDKMYRIAQNIYQHTIKGGHVILVCGNIWKDGEEIDLGVMVKEQFRKVGFKSRSHIIKDYGETKDNTFGKDYHLWYYRNLKNDTNFFYGDNIFILKKQ